MITCKRSKFTLPPRVTYLNCGYMSPLLKSAEKAGIRGVRRKRNPGNIKSTDFFTDSDLLRQEFAKLISATDPKRIVVVPSASYGISTVARNIKIGRGQNIILAAEQFPSNVYPWQRLCADTGADIKVVEPPSELLGRGKNWNEKILSAVDTNTKVVALGNVHWADGTLFQLEAIRKRTRDVGALLIIDGTQSVGALPFNIQSIQPDALICASYKWLLGPYSIGLAYYGEYFDNGVPIEESWINRLNSEDFSQLVNYQTSYLEGSLRYEMGEHGNFIQVPMLLNSIKQLNRWGIENIQAYCRGISQEAIQRLREKGYWIEDENYRSSHLFGIRFQDTDPQKLKDKLLRHNISVSFRGNAIRVAPNIYNDANDLKRLVNALS